MFHASSRRIFSRRTFAAASSVLTFGAAIGCVTLLGSPVAAQSVGESGDASIGLKRQTMARMLKRIEGVELSETRLEDLISFIEGVADADLEPLWTDENGGEGLERETLISLKTPRRVTVLQLLEMTLEQADRAAGPDRASTWQLTDYGTMEFGPRELLNRRQRLEVIDIHDLLLTIPDYDNPPNFDLNTIFNQAGQGGGGGGQAPFQINQQQQEERNLEEDAQEIIDTIVAFVEPEQWADNGGTGGSIRYFRQTLLVRAPDYMHRALSGYSWWPTVAQRAKTVDGRRVVSFSSHGVDLKDWAGEDASARSEDVITPTKASQSGTP